MEKDYPSACFTPAKPLVWHIKGHFTPSIATIPHAPNSKSPYNIMIDQRSHHNSEVLVASCFVSTVQWTRDATREISNSPKGNDPMSKVGNSQAINRPRTLIHGHAWDNLAHFHDVWANGLKWWMCVCDKWGILDVSYASWMANRTRFYLSYTAVMKLSPLIMHLAVFRGSSQATINPEGDCRVAHEERSHETFWRLDLEKTRRHHELSTWAMANVLWIW